MLEEFHFVPFTVSNPPPGPWLVFAPHPDDETFGMGGSLMLAKQGEIATHVVVMTDGALGGKLDNLVNVRQQELQKACDLLGVSSLNCLNQPDRHLSISNSLVCRIATLIQEIRPAAVFFPAPFEPHPDHRSTAQLVWAALQSLSTEPQGRQLEAPQAYSYEISVQSPINILLDITSVIADKRTAMAVYSSQNAENDYPQLVEGLNKGRSFTLPEPVRFAEGFFHYAPETLGLSLKEVCLGFVEKYWD